MKSSEKKQGRFWYFLRHINARHRVSFRNEEGDQERGFLYISTLRIVLLTLAVILTVGTGVVLSIIYTPLLDKLPVNVGREARERMIESVYKIDSLEEQLTLLQVYAENVSLIMDGKTPVTYVDRSDTTGKTDKVRVPTSREDSLFRIQMGPTLVPDAMRVGNSVKRMNFTPPVVAGRIVAPFDPRRGSFGIAIRFAEPQQIVAVQEGTVVSSGWTPEDEYSVMIQHRDNFLSIYRHTSQLLVSVGDRVSNGAVIAYTTPTQNATGDFRFELWYDGQVIDPELYVASLSNIR